MVFCVRVRSLPTSGSSHEYKTADSHSAWNRTPFGFFTKEYGQRLTGINEGLTATKYLDTTN